MILEYASPQAGAGRERKPGAIGHPVGRYQEACVYFAWKNLQCGQGKTSADTIAQNRELFNLFNRTELFKQELPIIF